MVEGFPNLRLLNLQENRLSEWSEIMKFSRLPKISQLWLGNNLLDSIHLENTCEPVFLVLRSLYLQDNRISSWHSVDQLNNLSSLENLKFVGSNPLLLTAESAVLARQWIIARIARLKSLNGGQIHPRERIDAEKLYLRQCVLDKVKLPGFILSNGTVEECERDHPRFKELVQKFGDPWDEFRQPAAATTSKQSVFSISLKSQLPDKKPVTRKLPASMTAQKIKVICQTLFKINAMSQQLWFCANKGARKELMDDDLKTLSFYGACDGDEILMEELDLAKMRHEQEQQEQQHENLMQQQLRDVDHMIKMQRHVLVGNSGAASNTDK